MNTENKYSSWSQDPRLKTISPERLRSLNEMAETLKNAPQNQKLSVFLSLQKNFISEGKSFSDTERELLISVLSEGLSAEDKNRMQMIKTMSAQMRAKET